LSKGEIRQKRIEGYNAYKYSVKTTFATTHYKANLSEVEALKQYKCFEDYLLSSPSNGDSTDLAGDGLTKPNFNATAPLGSNDLRMNTYNDDNEFR
jgi:hypothetical protein